MIDPGQIILLLVNALIGLGLYSIRVEVKGVKDLLATRIDHHEKRLDRLED